MIRHCEHVKSNGNFCGSPAMRDRNYCFFHLNHIGQRLRLERYAAHGLQRPPIELPLLEDAASIQLALMQVTEALLHGTLDAKRGGLVLYALQTASSNLRNMAKDAKEESPAAICDRYDSFEQDYELDDCAGLRVEEESVEQSLEAQAAEILSAAEHAGLTTPKSVQPNDEGKAQESTWSGDPDAAAQSQASASPHDDCGPATDGTETISSAAPRSCKTCERSKNFDVQNHEMPIPLLLTAEQYVKAKTAVFGYQMLHGIDPEHPNGRKPVPQRAAMSQKIFMGMRKPPMRVAVAEEVEFSAESGPQGGEMAVGARAWLGEE